MKTARRKPTTDAVLTLAEVRVDYVAGYRRAVIGTGDLVKEYRADIVHHGQAVDYACADGEVYEVRQVVPLNGSQPHTRCTCPDYRHSRGPLGLACKHIVHARQVGWIQ